MTEPMRYRVCLESRTSLPCRESSEELPVGIQHRGSDRAGLSERKRGAALDHPVIHFSRCYPALIPPLALTVDSHETGGYTTTTQGMRTKANAITIGFSRRERARLPQPLFAPSPDRRLNDNGPPLPAERRNAMRQSRKRGRNAGRARAHAHDRTGLLPIARSRGPPQQEGRGDRRVLPGIRG